MIKVKTKTKKKTPASEKCLTNSLKTVSPSRIIPYPSPYPPKPSAWHRAAKQRWFAECRRTEGLRGKIRMVKCTTAFRADTVLHSSPSPHYSVSQADLTGPHEWAPISWGIPVEAQPMGSNARRSEAKRRLKPGYLFSRSLLMGF